MGEDQNHLNGADSQTNPGEPLLQARVAMGLTREQLADRLHMGAHQIEVLECNQQDRWLEAVFTIAQVRRIAGALDLPAEPIVDGFRRCLSAQKPDGNSAAKLNASAASSERQPLQNATPLPLNAATSKPTRTPAQQFRGRPRWIFPAFGTLVLVGAVGLAIQRFGSQIPSLLSPSPMLSQPPKAEQEPQIAAISQPPGVKSDELKLDLEGPVWMSVRQLVDQSQVFEGLLESGTHRFPLGDGLQVLAGRPDLVTVQVGNQAARRLGTIETIEWTNFRPPEATGP